MLWKDREKRHRLKAYYYFKAYTTISWKNGA